jgi:rhodanese-related sulfurtransferase
VFQDIEITPADLVRLRESGAPVRVIDVREEWEWDYNRLPGAELLPLDQLEFRHAELLGKDDAIVVYCHHGMRSFQAAAWLRQEGYANVKSLSGGTERWADDVDPDMPRY